MDIELKEKEVLIDIESNEGIHAERAPSPGPKRGNISLKKLVSGFLNFNGSSSDNEARENPQENTKLLTDRNTENGAENDRPKVEKVKKASKPPRPPKGPTLDAADMRLLKEITKLAKKKQERIERIKAIRKMKAAKALSTSPSSSSPLVSSGATISALIITGFFFLVIIFQGLGPSTSSNVTLAGAPQPAPETAGLTPMEFYKSIMSDDGAAPSFLPPKSSG